MAAVLVLCPAYPIIDLEHGAFISGGVCPVVGLVYFQGDVFRVLVLKLSTLEPGVCITDLN